MSPILDSKGNTVHNSGDGGNSDNPKASKPQSQEDAALPNRVEQGAEPSAKEIPRPKQGDLLVGIYAAKVTDQGEKQQHVGVGFTAHPSLNPVQILELLDQMGAAIQDMARRQLANALVVAPADTLNKLKMRGSGKK